MKINKSKIPLILLIIFIVFAILLGINPKYRFVWFVENLILVVFIIFMIITYRKFKFSNTSYYLIFIFCILQTIGAHYSYSEVPIGFWFQEMFDLTRNHYDRLVHFSFGLLLTFPFREVLIKTSDMKNKYWLFLIPVLAAFTSGCIYEIFEWFATVTFFTPSWTTDPSLFLGSQGDIWDAEKDMFLVGLGSMVAMIITKLKEK